MPTTFALSLGLALLVNRPRFAQAFFRSVFFLPTACSYVVASLIWKMSIFSGVRFGLANTVLGWFGVEHDRLAVSRPTRPGTGSSSSRLRLWLQVGFYMILFLAGLQRIPPELYEAAAIDGAKPGWQTFRHITLPQLRATSTAVLLLLLIAAFQAFDEFYNLLVDVGTLPAVRPAAARLPVLHALGASQDFGHGQRGRGDPDR